MAKQISINGKNPNKQKAKKNVSAPVAVNGPDNQAVLTATDQAVENKIEELHVFLTQRGLPYILLTKRPDDKKTIARFSLNHLHDHQEITQANAEWMFANLGAMVRNMTNGILSLIKFY
jgi:hypothetical protein